MKLTGAKADAYVRTPGAEFRAVLLFGPDGGLVRERGKTICDHFVREDDPFCLTELTGDAVRKEPALLADSAQAMSLMGGDPVVRIRECGDALAPVAESWLEAGSGTTPVVFEAGELAPRSKLRSLFEKRKDTAAIGCYPDEGRNLEAVVRGHFENNGVRIDRDAMPVLLSRLGSDRLAVRQELDKLVLFTGGPGNGATLSIADVEAILGDVKTASLDDVAFAVTAGDTKRLGHALDRTFAEGTAAIAVLRAVQRHLDRLHAVSADTAAGTGLDQAVKKLKPPVFFKHRDAFMQQARSWQTGDLARGLSLLLKTERECKSGIEVDQALCERALLQLTQAARRFVR